MPVMGASASAALLRDQVEVVPGHDIFSEGFCAVEDGELGAMPMNGVGCA